MAHFLATYGLGLLFLVVALEAAGLPLPGETTLIAAAALAAHGDLDIVAVITVAAFGAILGDNGGYWLGRRGGPALIARWGWLERLSGRLLPRSERFFDRHGPKAVVFARFLPVLRVTGAWMAGLSGMSWWRFLFWNAVGSSLWAASIGVATFYAGQAAVDAVARYGTYGALAVIAMVLAALAAVHLLKQRLVHSDGDEQQDKGPQSAFARPLLLTLIPLAVFVTLAVAVMTGGNGWDTTLLRGAHATASPTLDRLTLLVAEIGSVPAALAVAAAGVLLLIARRRQRAALFLALAALGSGLGPLLKLIVARPRPALWARLEPVDGFSFPSGHALATALVVLALCLLAWRTRWHWLILVPGLAFVAAVGLSRVYLGVHYPSDVFASWTLAGAWLGLLHLTLFSARVRRKKNCV